MFRHPRFGAERAVTFPFSVRVHANTHITHARKQRAGSVVCTAGAAAQQELPAGGREKKAAKPVGSFFLVVS